MSGPPSASLSRRQVLAGCAAVGTVGLAGCASGSLDASATVTETYDGAEVSRLRIETTNGDVEITDADRDDFEVEGTKRAPNEGGLDDVSLEQEVEDGVLTLRVVVEDDGDLLSWGATPRLSLSVTTPRGLPVDVTSTNGDATLELAAPEAVDVETTNGDVEVETGNAAEVTAEATNGDVAVTLAEPADVTVETTNGDVTIDLPATAEPELSFETTNGAVEVTGLDAGSIDRGSSIETAIGAGTHRIAVTTTNGDLTVRGRSSDG